MFPGTNIPTETELEEFEATIMDSDDENPDLGNQTENDAELGETENEADVNEAERMTIENAEEDQEEMDESNDESMEEALDSDIENEAGENIGFDGDESRSEDEEMTAEDRLFLDDDTEMKECSSPGVSHLALLNARRFDDDDQALAR